MRLSPTAEGWTLDGVKMFVVVVVDDDDEHHVTVTTTSARRKCDAWAWEDNGRGNKIKRKNKYLQWFCGRFAVQKRKCVSDDDDGEERAREEAEDEKRKEIGRCVTSKFECGEECGV